MSNLSQYFSGKLIISVIVVSFVFASLFSLKNRWTMYADSTIDTQKSSETSDVNDNLRKYSAPVIEIINGYIDYGSSNYDLKNFVKAYDADTREDLTDKVKIYGSVNTKEYGVYKIHYVVPSSHGIKADKYGQVIVK